MAKFLAVALTLLLAVVPSGSQVVPLQADDHSQLEHYKAAGMAYLSQEGTQYEQYKMKLSESMDKLKAYAHTATQTLTTYGEALSTPVLNAMQQMREKVMAEAEELHAKLAVLQKHVKEYREKFGSVFWEHVAKNRENMDALHAKLQPLVDNMREKVQVNAEEIKSKLVHMVEAVHAKLKPLVDNMREKVQVNAEKTKSKLVHTVEAVRAKLTERLEELRTLAAPYAEEYNEQPVKAVREMPEKVAPHSKAKTPKSQ